MMHRRSGRVRALLAEEAQPLVLRRVQAVLGLGMVTIAASLAFDLRPGAAVSRQVLLVKLSGLAAYGFAALCLRMLRRSSWPWAMAGATASIGVICSLNA